MATKFNITLSVPSELMVAIKSGQASKEDEQAILEANRDTIIKAVAALPDSTAPEPLPTTEAGAEPELEDGSDSDSEPDSVDYKFQYEDDDDAPVLWPAAVAKPDKPFMLTARNVERELFKIQVKPSMTTSELASRLICEGTPADQVRLSFRGITFYYGHPELDIYPTQTLRDLDLTSAPYTKTSEEEYIFHRPVSTTTPITRDSSLDEYKTITVSIRGLSGQTNQITLPSSSTTKRLAQRVEEILGISIKFMTMVLHRRPKSLAIYTPSKGLDFDEPVDRLDFLGVEDGATIHLVLRLGKPLLD